MKKGAVSHDSKPAVKTAASDDSNRTEKTIVSNDSKPADKSAVSDESKPTEKASVSNDVKPTESGTAGETPFFDFTKLMSQFQLPGVDFATLVDVNGRISKLSPKRIGSLWRAGSASFVGKQKCSRRR